MTEDLSNIVMKCDDCAPKPGRYVKFPLEFFLGKHVKKAFPAVNPRSGEKTKEHMWVRIAGAEKGALVGTLDNKPLFKTKVKCGDLVRVKRSEVAEVFQP